MVWDVQHKFTEYNTVKNLQIQYFLFEYTISLQTTANRYISKYETDLETVFRIFLYFVIMLKCDSCCGLCG